NGGNDTLNGGPGADTLDGGANDDTYVVDDLGDVVLEGPAAGTDTVLSSIVYSLEFQPDVEHLTLTGDADIAGTGNGGANILVGNSGDNTLDGRAGVDSMSGGAGNDLYVVDHADDVVAENPGEGTDHVQSSADFILAANI